MVAVGGLSLLALGIYSAKATTSVTARYIEARLGNINGLEPYYELLLRLPNVSPKLRYILEYSYVYKHSFRSRPLLYRRSDSKTFYIKFFDNLTFLPRMSSIKMRIRMPRDVVTLNL